MASSSTSCDVTDPTYEEHLLRAEHYEKFQTWANLNYGENSKTKTVTRSKYARIMRILTGQEAPTSENAKLRFWVKSKGFEVRAVPCNVFGLSVEYSLFVPTKIYVSM